MKHSILSVAAAAALAIGLGACHDDCQIKNDGNASGTLSFASMSVDVSVAENVIRHTPARAAAETGSRAAVDLSDFIVTVTDAEGAIAGQWTYSTMPEIMTLPVASVYTVDVKSHEVQKAEWSRPYYCGSKTFDITEGAVTEIGEVRCTFSSIKVTIKFDDELLKKLDGDAVVNVLANDEGSLDFTPSETRSGYFAAVNGSSTLVATFDGKVSGSPTHLQRVFADVAAGQHRIITFKARIPGLEPDPETGTINPDGIGVDLEVESVDLNGNVNVGEDPIIGGDSPWKPPTPPTPPGPGPEDPESEFSFESEGQALSFDSPNTPVEGTNGKINIYSKLPIAHLRVNISTTSASFESAVGEMVGLAFDLAYPDDSKNETAKFSGLGFPVGDQVIGKNDLVFDITTFIPLLGAFPGTHDFVITVEDNAGGSDSRRLTFVAE